MSSHERQAFKPAIPQSEEKQAAVALVINLFFHWKRQYKQVFELNQAMLVKFKP